MIHKDRIKSLNNNTIANGKYVLYWMQASQRARFNHALEYAIDEANKLKKPVLVMFVLSDSFPEANRRHYFFMLEGLREIEAALKKRGLKFVCVNSSPEKAVVDFAHDASLVITDRGYLRIQKLWRSAVASNLRCPLIQVESDVVIPVETASAKEEYAAATLRPKIEKLLDNFLTPLRERKPEVSSLNLKFDSLDLSNPLFLLKRMKFSDDIENSKTMTGGIIAAEKLLENFIKTKLKGFAEYRNNPELDYLSGMSPYLHFGNISPLFIALKVKEAGSQSEEAYLEELIVRRELSMNFVYFNDNYDKFESIPNWAKETIHKHQKDKREFVYSRHQFEAAETHDEYWNAAQKEMMFTGKMSGYMRMYWGKKILEWSREPEEAYQTALYLNNKYEIDGRDPNGFAGVAWCFGKHDRPWGEREIFGNIRYMNANGLKRKFDIDKYVQKIETLSKS